MRTRASCYKLNRPEALTHVSQTHAPDASYAALSEHFSENQIVDLTLIIAAMNAWNRIAIGDRTQPAKHTGRTCLTASTSPRTTGDAE